MNQKITKYLVINLILFILSAIFAGYLAIHHYALINGQTGFHSFCSISQKIDCDVINGSQYAEIFGIPIAIIAFAYYIKALLLTIISLRNVYAQRTACFILFVLSTIAMLITLAMLIIATFLLKALCIFCAALYVLNTATFFISWIIWRSIEWPHSFVEELKKIKIKSVLGYLVIGAVILTAVHLITAQFEKFMPVDEEALLANFRAQPILSLDISHSPQMGFSNKNPPVQIIEFADFQCPACSLGAKWMYRLLKIYGDKIQLTFKNFPLNSTCNPNINFRMHENACIAAKAALCAFEQSKFEPMYERLFENQKQISLENIKMWASEIGIDSHMLETCMESPQTTQALMADIELATKSEVKSTPTFFINGRKVEGPINDARLRIILKELGQL